MQDKTNRIKVISVDEFKHLLINNLIRLASLQDVEGIHHQRPLFRHPNTGAYYTTVK